MKTLIVSREEIERVLHDLENFQNTLVWQWLTMAIQRLKKMLGKEE